MFQMSSEINELATALVSAQSDFKPISKDSTNPFFHSKYSSLTSVIENTKNILAKYGLSVSQLCSGGDGSTVNLTTILMHNTGQWIAGTITMTAKDASPQAIGSCITYARRYSLAAILGVASEEDDDGNVASKPDKPQLVTQSMSFASGSRDIIEDPPSNEEYIVNFGKFKGTSFKKIPFNEAKSYARFLEDNAQKTGKSLFAGAQKFVNETAKLNDDPFGGDEVPF